MRKIFLLLNVVVLTTLLFTSCDNTKTYAERLTEEQDRISKLLADSFVVIPFHKDSLYTPQNKHIMQLSDGAYLAIISKRNKLDTAVAGTVVTYRYRNSMFLSTGTKIDNTLYPQPCQFIYKRTATTSFYSQGTSSCQGLQDIMPYLGNGAKVKLIIPSKISYTDLQQITVVETVYFDELTLTFSVQD